MSIISNIAIQQNPQAKKSFGKIAFEAGETFNARIVSTDQQKGEVNLKLLDGWQFSAKLDKPLEQAPEGSVLKFQVEGFENEKLNIKLVYEDKEGKTVENEGLVDFSNGKSLGTEKADALLFSKMIKHDMPLTKENIIDIKNLVDFREKITLNSNKEEIFIAKYLDSRNIDPSSEKAIEITKDLKSFFTALKNLDIDEMLLFKENNIELTKGNMDSFIKLFKGQSAIYNNLKDINTYLSNSDTNSNTQKNIHDGQLGGSENSFMDLKEGNEVFTNVDFKNISKDAKNLELLTDSKIIDKTSVLDDAKPNSDLKGLISLINKELKDLEVNYRVPNSIIKSLELDKNLQLVKNPQIDKNLQLNVNLELDKKIEPGNINFNRGTIIGIVDKIFKESDISLSLDSYIKLIKNLDEKLNIPKADTFSVKLENKALNDELSLNIMPKGKTNETELDTKSFVNNKTSVYGKSNSINEILNMIKKELNISDVEKGNINSIPKDIDKITTDFLIKEQVKLKTEEIKTIVKDLIENKLNIKPESYEKVMSLFHEKLNDLKMFNTVSEQYYLLDLPINVKDDEYQFKLIIKDDRKKGKKIDSKNVKIATSVKTINMGTVDAYIKINNNNMNIDINCDKFWVKVLKLGKEKLMTDLSNLNYRVNIEVNNKTKEFTLANCGEFFDDRSFNTLNIKV